MLTFPFSFTDDDCSDGVLVTWLGVGVAPTPFTTLSSLSLSDEELSVESSATPSFLFFNVFTSTATLVVIFLLSFPAGWGVSSSALDHEEEEESGFLLGAIFWALVVVPFAVEVTFAEAVTFGFEVTFVVEVTIGLDEIEVTWGLSLSESNEEEEEEEEDVMVHWGCFKAGVEAFFTVPKEDFATVLDVDCFPFLLSGLVTLTVWTSSEEEESNVDEDEECATGTDFYIEKCCTDSITKSQ